MRAARSPPADRSASPPRAWLRIAELNGLSWVMSPAWHRSTYPQKRIWSPPVESNHVADRRIRPVLTRRAWRGMEPLVRIERTPQPYRGRAPPTTLQGRKLGPGTGLEPVSLGYESSASPSTLTRNTPWVRRPVSNGRLLGTSQRFCQLNYSGMERVTGFEPVSTAWQAMILAAGRHPRKTLERNVGVQPTWLVWKTSA